MPIKWRLANILAHQGKQYFACIVTLHYYLKPVKDGPMKEEDKLQEEIEFWYAYIQDWQTQHDEPISGRVLALLDNVLLKQKNYCLEKKRVKFLPGSNHLLH
jgi:hypothetical protein